MLNIIVADLLQIMLLQKTYKIQNVSKSTSTECIQIYIVELNSKLLAYFEFHPEVAKLFTFEKYKFRIESSRLDKRTMNELGSGEAFLAPEV